MMLRMLFRIRTITVVAAGFVFVSCGPADPVLLDTRVLVEELASDEFEGRLTGSAGIKKAAEYITGQLNTIGAEPLPGSADFGRTHRGGDLRIVQPGRNASGVGEC